MNFGDMNCLGPRDTVYVIKSTQYTFKRGLFVECWPSMIIWSPQKKAYCLEL